MAEASRLGRDRLRTELVARDLHEAGIRLFYYLTGEEERLDTPEGRFILAARSFAAELERAKAKERTRDAHMARARKAQVTGGCVYGYSNVAVDASGDRSRRTISLDPTSFARSMAERLRCSVAYSGCLPMAMVCGK